MLPSPGANSQVMKVLSKRPVLLSQRHGVIFKKNFISRKHRWKFLYGISYCIVPFSLLCVGTGVDCTCLAEINSIQNSCIVILELKNPSTCMLRYVPNIQQLSNKYWTCFMFVCE